MAHSPAFHTARTKHVVIPPSFFSHASQAGQSSRSSKLASVQPDRPSPVRNEGCMERIVLIILQIKMSFASQQAARLAQRRVAKQNEAMTTETTTKVSSISSTISTTSLPRRNYTSASSTSPSIFSSSQRSQDISQTIKVLRSLEDRLDDLLSKFHVIDPTYIISPHLDPCYLYRRSQVRPLKHLSITSEKFPVIVALGELLKSLEQELGLVEAHGNQDIEVWRKGVANRIKKIAAYLEKTVHGLWSIVHPKQT
ncbi:hypothetical protein C0992_002516 [Termitomyces sp. T32_za158]|nr:hypothetical protein C0992_002516 [Termitomyces sp. T32_za158]